MELIPLKRYSGPDYPDRQVIDRQPEMLNAIPDRWRRNSTVLAALAGAFVLLPAVRAQDVNILPGDVAAPLVKLTESEARDVIIAEAKRAGINFKEDSRTAKITVPVTQDKAGNANKQKTETIKLVLDGTDSKRNISYEFISEDDIKDWKARHPGWKVDDSISSTAELKQAIEKTDPKAKIGVFRSYSYSKESARADLRGQMQEFVKWLKRQGVI